MADTVVVNGVFEGGGVKGLMYVGALEACEHAQVSFGAVAGSSAGAITAMLVACGYSASELEQKIPDAFDALGNPKRALPLIGRKSLLSSKRLRTWLGDSIAQKLNERSGTNLYDDSATFADIRAVTGITLYVVSVDLDSGQPIVFSPDLTPDMTVADAVVASSSIPVAFPAQRIRVGTEVHKVVDGGVWANYPSFVFCDSHFRAYHRGELRDGAESRTTLGFILDEVEGKPVINPGESVQALSPNPSPSDSGSVERTLGIAGSLLASPIIRACTVLLPLLFLAIGMSWFDREIDAGLPIIREYVPTGFEDAVLMLLIVLFAGLVVQSVLFAALMLRFGRSITDEGLVGATAALGVGASVPYWVGFIQDREALGHIAIRLPVPPQLKTLTSGIDEALSEHAIGVGFRATMLVLIRNFIGVPGEAPPPAPPPPQPAPRALHPLLVIGFWVVAPLSFLLLALETIQALADKKDPWWALPGLIAFALAMFAFHAVSRARSARASGSWFTRLPRPILLCGALGATLLALLILAVQLDESISRELSIGERIGAERLQGEVVGVTESAGSPITQVRLDTTDLPRYTDPVENLPRPYIDLNSDLIRSCGTRCLEFPRIAELDPGEPVEVRFDRNDGVAFLKPDRWETTGVDALIFLFTIALLGLGLRSWRAYQARPELEGSSTLAPPMPPPPPPPPPSWGSPVDGLDLRDKPERVIRF